MHLGESAVSGFPVFVQGQVSMFKVKSVRQYSVTLLPCQAESKLPYPGGKAGSKGFLPRLGITTGC